MERFWKEFDKGGILRIRDQLQFEIQSNFYHLPNIGETIQTQEFYFFIPNSLQINHETYTKEKFYQDQTNLIRFKTPEFTLKELLSSSNSRSPLWRLNNWIQKNQVDQSLQDKIQDELQLFGSILKSSVRQRVKEIIFQLDPRSNSKKNHGLNEEVFIFVHELKNILEVYTQLQDKCKKIDAILFNYFFYVEEFISNEVNYYLTILLERMRNTKSEEFLEGDKMLSEFILKEKQERQARNQEPELNNPDSLKNEFISHQNNLLKKFVTTALLPDVTRISSDSKIKNWIGSFSAGIAMFFYLLLFIWGGSIFVINSFPFVLITVVFYVLKDRLKEGLKNISHRQTLKWISDYTTKIRFRNQEEVLGNIRESFTYVKPNKIPAEIVQVRNQGFHSTLESFKRPENAFYYKKMVSVYHKEGEEHARRHELHNVFRFNVHAFLQKAANPYFQYTSLDPETHQLVVSLLPKVYHINIILKNTFQISKNHSKTNLKKFRLIIDKTGIKRIEEIK